MTRPAILASTPRTSAPAAPAPRRTPRGAAGRLGRALAVGAATLGLAAVAGCTTQSPAQTQVPYQPADGVALDAGSVLGRDLLVVASAKGATGVLSGSLINTGTTSVTVSFAQASADGTPSAQTTPLTLAPREQKRLSTVEIPEVAVAPGALTQLTMTTSGGAAQAAVPVLAPTEYYATLTPKPTATPSATTATTAPTTSATSEAPTPSATTTTTAG